MKYTDRKYSFNNSVRFRKWSRKAYAIFMSLRFQVSIGHVSKGIADSALTKNENTDLSSIAQKKNYTDNDTYNGIEDIINEFVETNISAQNLMPAIVTSDCDAACSDFLFYNILTVGKRTEKSLFADGFFIYFI